MSAPLPRPANSPWGSFAEMNNATLATSSATSTANQDIPIPQDQNSQQLKLSTEHHNQAPSYTSSSTQTTFVPMPIIQTRAAPAISSQIQASPWTKCSPAPRVQGGKFGEPTSMFAPYHANNKCYFGTHTTQTYSSPPIWSPSPYTQAVIQRTTQKSGTSNLSSSPYTQAIIQRTTQNTGYTTSHTTNSNNNYVKLSSPAERPIAQDSGYNSNTTSSSSSGKTNNSNTPKNDKGKQILTTYGPEHQVYTPPPLPPTEFQELRPVEEYLRNGTPPPAEQPVAANNQAPSPISTQPLISLISAVEQAVSPPNNKKRSFSVSTEAEPETLPSNNASTTTPQSTPPTSQESSAPQTQPQLPHFEAFHTRATRLYGSSAKRAHHTLGHPIGSEFPYQRDYPPPELECRWGGLTTALQGSSIVNDPFAWDALKTRAREAAAEDREWEAQVREADDPEGWREYRERREEVRVVMGKQRRDAGEDEKEGMSPRGTRF